MATPDDIATVQRWASTEERRRLLADAVSDLGSNLRPRQTKVWAAVATNIAKETSSGVAYAASGKRTRLGTQPLRPSLVSVAAFVLIVGVLIGVWDAGARHSIHSAAHSGLVYSTGNGERATISLPDGGTVALNVASRLEVPLDYMAGNHAVRLTGEGLFTVPHQDGAPFTVLTNTTATRVLGTSFVVRRYPTDTATMVAVRDGKVAVGPMVVAAQQMVEVGHNVMARVRPAAASSFTFATGVLTLDGVPLSAAITELDRWFDADIRLGNPALAAQFQSVHGTFAAGSIGNLTEILELTNHVRVVRNGRVLTLFPR